MAKLGDVSVININGNEMAIKDAAVREIVNEIIEAIGANNTNISERINDLHNRSFDYTLDITSNNDSEIASIHDGIYKLHYVTVTDEGEEATKTLNNSAILIQNSTNQYRYKDGQLSSRTKTGGTWGNWITFEGGVTSVNGQTGAVTVKANVQSDWNATTGDAVILNKPDLTTYENKVTSVNGMTGAVTISETQLSKGTATGTGNAVTDINVSNHQIILVKGATYATQSDIDTSIANLVDSAPETLNTLNELADALGNDANFATTVATQIGEKYTKPSTGIPASDLANGVIPDVPVQSVNGMTGAVTINVGVTSFNGSTGAVTYTAPVTSVNGATGAVTVKANVQSDWNATTGDAVILNKPTIPTVNDSTVTLTMNGNTVGTFTLNKSGNTTIDLGTILTSHQSIKTVNNESLIGTGNVTIQGLPTVTSADNGKVLMVVNGAWQLVSPVSLYSGSSAPSNSQGNNGDIYVQS